MSRRSANNNNKYYGKIIIQGFFGLMFLQGLHLIKAFQQNHSPLLLTKIISSSRVCRSGFHSTTSVYLNRFLFDSYEIVHRYDDEGEEQYDEGNRGGRLSSSSQSTTIIPPKVILPKDDYRTIHAAKILGLKNGDQLRAGIVSCDDYPLGLWTDTATIQWIPEGKVKKSEPLKNGNPPGSLLITLDGMHTPTTSSTTTTNTDNQQQDMIPVSLILALPRPLQLGRMLPMISQMGVDQLVLTGSRKVPKDYFGSHLFRKPEVLREKLIEGLCQAGDVRLPNITVVKNICHFLLDDLDEMFPMTTHARVIAHPQRIDSKIPPLRMGNIKFPTTTNIDNSDNNDLQQPQQQSSPRRIVIAVGPEGGWEEPDELDMFQNLGFQQITLGTRTLRSDCAVISLMSLAHEACQT